MRPVFSSLVKGMSIEAPAQMPLLAVAELLRSMDVRVVICGNIGQAVARRIRPFGMKGSRLVSDFLKDLGMPQVERRVLEGRGPGKWEAPSRHGVSQP